MGHIHAAARTIAAALLAAAPACASTGEPLTPDADVASAEGTYVLRTAAGAGLPAVWIVNESVRVTVLADTFTLRERGQGRRVSVERYRQGSEQEETVLRAETELTYSRRGDRIEITPRCPDLALCVAPPHFVGRMTAGGLVFDAALNYATPLRYARVSR